MERILGAKGARAARTPSRGRRLTLRRGLLLFEHVTPEASRRVVRFLEPVGTAPGFLTGREVAILLGVSLLDSTLVRNAVEWFLSGRDGTTSLGERMSIAGYPSIRFTAL